jgi:hypothetical protein
MKPQNIMQLLLWAEHVPELKCWLQRTKYKWTSRDTLNEIISLLSNVVVQ